MEKRKCLARELSDLIIYAVAVPFDHESRFKSWWIIYTGVNEGHYILGYVNERGFGVFFLLKLWPNELERKNLKIFFKNDCAWSHYYYVALVLWILIDQNNSFMDIGPLNNILVCCMTLMNNLIFFKIDSKSRKIHVQWNHVILCEFFHLHNYKHWFFNPFKFSL